MNDSLHAYPANALKRNRCLAAGGAGINKFMMKTPGLLFGPRLGVTYDITGRGNFIARGLERHNANFLRPYRGFGSITLEEFRRTVREQ